MKLSQTTDAQLETLKPAHFDVLFTVTNIDNEELRQSAEIIYRDLMARGLKVVMDDRSVTNAKKLFDPKIEVRLSNEGLRAGVLETFLLSTTEKHSVPVEDIAETVAAFVGKN